MRPNRRASQRPRPAMQLEVLESRDLLSCVVSGGATYDSATGVLTVNGTNRSDNIAVAVQMTHPGPIVFGDLVVALNGSQVARCLTLDVTNPLNKLVINGGNGNDKITVDDAVFVGVQANGGNGQDVIDGGGGNDTLSGGNGKDSIDGAAGNDEIHGGNGADNLQGGIGTDVVTGDNGPDTLADPDGDTGLNGGNGRDLINGHLEAGHGHENKH
jgi:Ca2+-binding RTX toxin-like protein